jgi:hypothetical protein
MPGAALEMMHRLSIVLEGQPAFLEKQKPADANLQGSFAGGRGKQFVQNDYAQ